MGVRLKESAGMPGKPIAATTAVMPESAREKHSDTGELYRNLDRRCGVIDTPMTKVAYGFLGAAGPVSLTGMDVTVRNEFAVVAVSSLAGSPIDGSENLLVTAVGRADNTGCRYNEDHTVQLDAGHGPIRVEAIEARISIKTSQKLLRVLAINPDGFVIGYIEGEYDRGAYTFEIGGKYASMYYLIQKR